MHNISRQTDLLKNNSIFLSGGKIETRQLIQTLTVQAPSLYITLYLIQWDLSPKFLKVNTHTNRQTDKQKHELTF